MFIRKKVLGVSKGSLRMRNQGESRVAAFAPSKREVKASLGFGDGVASGGGFNTNISMNAMWPSEYQYYLTGILNGGDPQFNDPSALIYFYKDMYQYDATAGSAVDIQSTFPFSDFELRGLDAEKLKPFQDAVTRLNLRRMLPEISIAYLTYGYFCGSLLFDPVEKQFIDTMPHSALTCRVKNPVLYNLDPEITVRSSIAVQDLLSNGSVYTQRYLANVPRSFIELLRQGSFTLDPIATLYVPRRTLGDTAYSSYLHRILPMYLIEKTLFRGTLSEAHKRQRAMSHITAGDDVWTPSPEELAQIVGQFQAAEFDPLGGWVSTRNAVQVTDLRPGGDFWKWYETGDSLVPYKLRALGISESFLSGDASYAAAESAYSSFLESQDAYRSMLTDRIFYQKIFPLVAVVNGLYKKGVNKKRIDNPINFLFNAASRSDLEIPELYWQKQLNADDESSMFDMLEKLDEHGVPVPMKTWIAAAGMDPESLLKELDEDSELRAKLEKFTGKDTSHDQDEDFGDDEFQEEASVLEAAPFTINSGATRKIPILKRRWEGNDAELFAFTKTGKKKHIINQTQARKRSNDNIVKAAVNARDPNYRKFLRERNIKNYGTATIPGAVGTKRK